MLDDLTGQLNEAVSEATLIKDRQRHHVSRAEELLMEAKRLERDAVPGSEESLRVSQLKAEADRSVWFSIRGTDPLCSLDY